MYKPMLDEEMDRHIRILIIEDKEEHATLVVRQLQKAGFAPEYVRVESAEAMKTALADEKWDIIISDFALDGFDGEEALKIYNASHVEIPFILVSGSVGEDTAVNMMKAGASDYIMKDKLARLAPAVTRELVEFANRRENKKVQEAWLDSEERFRAAFENTPIGMDLIALDGKITQVNKAFCEMIGYTAIELISTNFRDLTHADDLPASNVAMQQLLDGIADTVKFEKRYRCKSGDYIWVNVASSVVKNQHGEPLYLIVQAEDITQKKLLADEILRAKEKVEESDRLKSALLTNMSHELRTPMNGILGFAELITRSNAPNDVKNMAELIDLSGKRLMHALDSIMLLAQLQAGTKKPGLYTNLINISQEITRIAHPYDTMITEKGMHFNLEIEPSVVSNIDPKLLRHIITKLLENAVKFTHYGSITLSLKTLEQESRSYVEICVSDTGIGIQQSSLDAIFEEFRQASEGYDRSYEGIGIGLTIVKRIVELFQGTITVSSTFGEGSTFTILLPLQDTDETVAVPVCTIPTTAYQPKSSEFLRRILIVEDNMVNTKLMVHFIRDAVQMIDCASTGESAVDMAKTNMYDAIMMDINLGAGMDGLQATQIISKQPGYESVPIIAVTGYTLIGDKERLLAGGCSHYVGKPFTQETINDLIKQLLALKAATPIE